MKRAYTTPILNVIDIKTERIIATSVDINSFEFIEADESLTNKKEDPIWGSTEEGNGYW